jgi:hypothetical protein
MRRRLDRIKLGDDFEVIHVRLDHSIQYATVAI